MISFVLVGTNDLDRATEFYDKICAAFGAKRLYQMTAGCTGVMYGTGEGPTLGVVLPFDGKPARGVLQGAGFLGKIMLSNKTRRALVAILLLGIATTLTIGSIQLLMRLEVLR